MLVRLIQGRYWNRVPADGARRAGGFRLLLRGFARRGLLRLVRTVWDRIPSPIDPPPFAVEWSLLVGSRDRVHQPPRRPGKCPPGGLPARPIATFSVFGRSA